MHDSTPSDGGNGDREPSSGGFWGFLLRILELLRDPGSRPYVLVTLVLVLAIAVVWQMPDVVEFLILGVTPPGV
jgi:hypothetical protein